MPSDVRLLVVHIHAAGRPGRAHPRDTNGDDCCGEAERPVRDAKPRRKRRVDTADGPAPSHEQQASQLHNRPARRVEAHD